MAMGRPSIFYADIKLKEAGAERSSSPLPRKQEGTDPHYM